MMLSMPAKKKQEKKPPSQFVGRDTALSPSLDSSTVEKIDRLIALSEEVLADNRKIKRRLTLMAVGSYLRLLIILVPIVLGVIYLPTLLENTFGEYSAIFQALGTPAGGTAPIAELFGNLSDDQLNNIIQQVRP